MTNICVICNEQFAPHKQHPNQRVCYKNECRKEARRRARHDYYILDKIKNPEKYRRVPRSMLDDRTLEIVRQKDRETYQKNIEKNRERARKYHYAHKEDNNRRSLAYRYAHLEELRERDRKRKIKYTGKNRVRSIAHAKLWKALATGRLIKQPCEVCGSHDVEAHHTNYNNPLDIKWLCPVHHKEWHKNNQPIYPKETYE